MPNGKESTQYWSKQLPIVYYYADVLFPNALLFTRIPY